MTAGRKSAGGGTKNKSRCISSGSGYARKRESIAATLVLTSSFGLLLPLEARADVMLTLLDLSDNAILLAAALETLSALSRDSFSFTRISDIDFPPSGASGSIRDAFRADITASIIIVNRKSKVKRSLQFFSNFCRFQAERPDSITLR